MTTTATATITIMGYGNHAQTCILSIRSSFLSFSYPSIYIVQLHTHKHTHPVKTKDTLRRRYADKQVHFCLTRSTTMSVCLFVCVVVIFIHLPPYIAIIIIIVIVVVITMDCSLNMYYNYSVAQNVGVSVYHLYEPYQ